MPAIRIGLKIVYPMGFVRAALAESLGDLRNQMALSSCAQVAVSRLKRLWSLSMASLLVVTGIIADGCSAYGNGCGYPTDDEVIVFQNTNRGGKCRILPLGLYSTPSAFSPVPNDAVSSLDVGRNSRVVLSEHSNFAGRQAYYDGGWFYNLGGTDVDNITSAVEVFPAAGGPMAAFYVGDYPSDATQNITPWWGEDLQGIAHEDSSWYFTNKTTLLKMPFTGVGRTIRSIPSAMVNAGYNHFGDLDQAYGYLLVPVQGEDKNSNAIVPALAVFRASDLSFVGWRPIMTPCTFTTVQSDCQPGSEYPDPVPGVSNMGAWVAYRPNTNTLFFSGGDISDREPLYEYSLKFLTHSNNPVLLTFIRNFYLVDRRSNAVTIKTTQGGVFNPTGTLLYLVNGYCHTDDGSIRVFNLDEPTGTTSGVGTLQAESENGFGPFNFEHHGGLVCDEEPEGIDFFDTTGRGLSHIPDSQLHVLLLRNALGADGVYIKHYSY
jgi:hypothetical protein